MNYRLAPDYECHPIWVGEEDDYQNLDPGDLPLSADLQGAIRSWARQYESTYNRADPASSGFGTDEEEHSFDKVGRLLSYRLKAELGAGNVITYFSVIYGWEIV